MSLNELLPKAVKLYPDIEKTVKKVRGMGGGV